MRGGVLARRYVQPLFEVAREKDELERIYDDLKSLDQALSDSPELKGYLSDPSIEKHDKKSVLEKIFEGASIYTLNFMRVLIDKNRPEVLWVAYPLFRDMLNEHRGISTGVVETAVTLEDADFSKIKSALESRFESRLDLERKVNPDLLAGLRVRIGNVVLDGSVRNRLTRLKEMLVAE